LAPADIATVPATSVATSLVAVMREVNQLFIRAK
jgi:hypothetical protein